MTNQDYFDTLLKLSGVKNYEPGVAQRKLSITVAMDDYGKPSTAIIAFEGSPPRFEVVFRMENSHTPIMVNGRVIGARTLNSANKYDSLHSFLRGFIESRKDEWNGNLPKV